MHNVDFIYKIGKVNSREELQRFIEATASIFATNASGFSARSEFLASQGSVYSLTGSILGSPCKQFVTIKKLVCLSMITLTYQSGPKIRSHLISYCFSVLLAKRYQHALIETSSLDLGVKR